MPFEFAAKSALVLIDKYNIIFRDEKHSTAAEITGMELVSTEFNLNSYADIKTKGTFTVENKAVKQVSPYASSSVNRSVLPPAGLPGPGKNRIAYAGEKVNGERAANFVKFC